MTAGETGVCTEVFADFKGFVETCHHAHLFVQLRTLRKAGFLSEVVFKFEHFASAFTGQRCDFGRVNFDEVVFVEKSPLRTFQKPFEF